MWAEADTASLEIAVFDRGTMHRCLVRVVDYRPEDPTEWCSPADACNLTGTQLTAVILKEIFFGTFVLFKEQGFRLARVTQACA